MTAHAITKHRLNIDLGVRGRPDTCISTVSQYILAMIVWVRQFPYSFYMKNNREIFTCNVQNHVSFDGLTTWGPKMKVQAGYLSKFYFSKVPAGPFSACLLKSNLKDFHWEWSIIRHLCEAISPDRNQKYFTDDWKHTSVMLAPFRPNLTLNFFGSKSEKEHGEVDKIKRNSRNGSKESHRWFFYAKLSCDI